MPSAPAFKPLLKVATVYAAFGTVVVPGTDTGTTDTVGGFTTVRAA